ncbi:hypothetical protein B7P43_G14565 [Cryptotermes secundus]|uniref:Uncharacterized protein n=2 Tax=Cryptotermes secundus TaxID=105785 RepID=A0A2J7R9I3_9NEOP|nr:hypothetical protein B7P43_G14565 [Cryptotermes secundus]
MVSTRSTAGVAGVLGRSGAVSSNMQSSQGSFFLLGLMLLLGVACTVHGSVRPASVAEIRETLVWGPERDIRKEIEDGILLPPLPPEAKVRKEVWGKSMNFIQPITKPLSAVQLFHTPLNRLKPDFDITLENKGDVAPMSYVDSSQFRRSSSKAESPPFETVPATKKFAGKSTVLAVPKTQINKTSKLETLTENRKKYELDQRTTTEDALGKNEDGRPRAAPPVWSHALLSDELSDPFSRLPSNEEYDRSSRYTHSILYGFNAEF